MQGELYLVVVRPRSRSVPCRVKVTADHKLAGVAVNDGVLHRVTVRADRDVVSGTSGSTSDVIVSAALDGGTARRCRAGSVGNNGSPAESAKATSDGDGSGNDIDGDDGGDGGLVFGHLVDDVSSENNLTWFLDPTGFVGCLQVISVSAHFSTSPTDRYYKL